MAVEIDRSLLELAARRLAELTGEEEFVMVGRGTLGITAPTELRRLAVTNDIDMWPRYDEKAGLDESIDALGEGSLFQEQHGFYVERVGSWTMLTQPAGWEERATKLTFGNIAVLVLGLLDLMYNKLDSWRDKDREFLRSAFSEKLATPDDLERFVRGHVPQPDVLSLMLDRLSEVRG